MKKQREFGPDLARAVAVTFVIAVHYFLYTGFYNLELKGALMISTAYLRMALMTCVPLFLVLTGYFCYKKTWSLKYYRGILGTIISYVLACVACILFRVFYMKEEMIFLGIIRRILDYSAAPYAWYVEMYIGLFLLIPFFNAAWNAIGDKGKLALLLSLLLLSSAPTVLNQDVHVLPDWWMDLYPLFYYALGAWLREHPLKFKKIWSLLGWLGMTALATAFQLYIFKGGVFGWSMSSARGSLLVAGETFFLFSALVGVKGEKIPKGIKWCVKKVAALSFPAYLVSYIGDTLVYNRLNNALPDFSTRMIWYIPCVIAILIFSCIIAQIIDLINRFVLKHIPVIIKDKDTVAV